MTPEEEKLPICSVFMPFGEAGTEEAASSLKRFLECFTPAAEQAGFKAVRVDTDPPPGQRAADGIETYLNAPMSLFDLSSNNPNVFFELGYRYARRLPLVCVSDGTGKLPFLAQWNAINHKLVNAIADITKRLTDESTCGSSAQAILNDVSDELATLLKTPRPGVLDRFIALRLASIRTELHSARLGRWNRTIYRPNPYVARLFTQFVDDLKESDCYDTITNLEFWSETEVGGSEFLTANGNAAKRGVVIRRLILVDEPRLATDATYVATAIKCINDHRAESKTCDNLKTKVWLCPDYRAAIKRYGHYARLRIHAPDAVEVLVTPNHHSGLAGGETKSLDIVFGSHATKSGQDTIKETGEQFTAIWAKKASVNIEEHDVLGEIVRASGAA
ncbi:MAG: hypothetical protein ACR2GY_09785 [Phycisphaerales bacterium]